jgi:hypothetical protein
MGSRSWKIGPGVSTGSAKATLQQLFSKTGVRTRSQFVRIALEQPLAGCGKIDS